MWETKYYIIKVFNDNNKLMYLQYKNNESCEEDKRHNIELPNNGLYTIKVLAMSEFEEGQPDSKEISKYYSN